MVNDAGRKRKYGKEKLSERIVYYVTESQRKELGELSERDVSGYTRARVFNDSSLVSSLGLIPVTGYIASDSAEVHDDILGQIYISSVLQLPSGCYALLIIGDGMEDTAVSLRDGSSAFFSPDVHPPYGGIVHIGVVDKKGNNKSVLKRYFPQPDGSIHLHSLDFFHSTDKKPGLILKSKKEFQVKGVFMEGLESKVRAVIQFRDGK